MKGNPESSKQLPFDLINNEILPKLPVKSLVRFTSVCKTWYSLIKSSDFVANHLKNNLLEAKGQYLQIVDNDSCYILKNETLTQLAKFDLPSDSDLGFSSFGYVESCNGLTLVQSETDWRNLLWNPSIRKYKKLNTNYLLPNRDTDNSMNGYTLHGLGFHELTNDHRVVRIVYFVDKESDKIAGVSTEVCVYSLSTDTWHRVDSSPGQLLGFNGGVFLNRATHWLAARALRDFSNGFEILDYFESILLFDFKDECFRKMVLPEEMQYNDKRLLSFIELEGSLTVVFKDEEFDVCCLWVMNEYGVTESLD